MNIIITFDPISQTFSHEEESVELLWEDLINPVFRASARNAHWQMIFFYTAGKCSISQLPKLRLFLEELASEYQIRQSDMWHSRW